MTLGRRSADRSRPQNALPSGSHASHTEADHSDSRYSEKIRVSSLNFLSHSTCERHTRRLTDSRGGVQANQTHRERRTSGVFAQPCCCASEPQYYSRDRQQLVASPPLQPLPVALQALDAWLEVQWDLKARTPPKPLDPRVPLPWCIWRSRSPLERLGLGCEAVDVLPPRCTCWAATG